MQDRPAESEVIFAQVAVGQVVGAVGRQLDHQAPGKRLPGSPEAREGVQGRGHWRWLWVAAGGAWLEATKGQVVASWLAWAQGVLSVPPAAQGRSRRRQPGAS